MKVDEILEEWSKDSRIDQSKLDIEALKVSELHHKYYKMFIPEKIKLKKMKEDLKLLKKLKWEYYNNNLSPEECKDLGWEPLRKKILKTDVDRFIDADSQIIEDTLKIAIQEEKAAVLQDIIASLRTRSFNLRVAMDFIKFSNGV
jgi:hypothetical protein